MDFKPVRHDEFYMESVIFLVENTLFKIPRFPFEHSSIFATVFSLPAGENKDVDGRSDEHPFKLDGVSRIDFQTFLRVMYPSDAVPRYPPMTAEEWVSVLKLSTMWDFRETRKLAIRELSKEGVMDLIMKVALARQYKVPDWLIEGYEALIKREEAISDAEAEQLGLLAVVRLFRIREESIARIPRQCVRIIEGDWGGGRVEHYKESGPFNRADCSCEGDIQREFVEELKEVGEVAE